MDLVVVERMPDNYRDSHRAAHNWGVFPCNGAQRVVMSREDAEIEVKDDPDGYNRIVRDALSEDLNDYERLLTPEYV